MYKLDNVVLNPRRSESANHEQFSFKAVHLFSLVKSITAMLKAASMCVRCVPNTVNKLSY